MKSGITKKIPVLYFVAAGILVAAIAGYMLLVRPAKEDASAAATEVENTQLQITTVQQQLAAKEEQQNLIRVADLVELAKAMPNQDGPAAAMLQLVDTADGAGVTLAAVQPAAPELAAGYTRFPMTLTVVGNYYDLTEFLYQLRNLVTIRQGVLDATGPLFTVDSISWHESDEADEEPFPYVQADLVVSAYVYGEATEALLAAAVASGDAPTPAEATTTGETTTGETTTTEDGSTTPSTSTEPGSTVQVSPDGSQAAPGGTP
ncbi:MAG: type 4a pilus biogenesis protein PilO [Gaiellales bacterium]